MRRPVFSLRSFFLLLPLLLAACGGGGTGGPLDGGDVGTPTEPNDDAVLSGSFQITMEDEDNPGVEITSISRTSPGLLLMTLLDSNGNPVVQEVVQIDVVLGAGELSAATALTDANGVARVFVNVADSDAPGAGGRVRAVYQAGSGDTTEGFYNYEVVNSGTTSTAGFQISVELYEAGVDTSTVPPTGTATSTVSSANPGTLVVRVTDTITSNPIPNAIVSVSTDVGVLVPESGNALTNANGVATLTVTSDGTAAQGAGTLLVSVDDVQASRNFNVGSVPLQLGRDNNGYVDVVNNLDFVSSEITVSNNNIAASGSTALRVVVADEAGNVYTQPVTVNFTSPCSIAGTATLDTGITTTSGVAVSTYQSSSLCSGQTDTVTAVIEDVSGASASGDITIASSLANSIRFVSATPEFMRIKGAGEDSAELVFEVRNDAGDPQIGEVVSYSLTTSVGGITLTTNQSETTGPDGRASVRVNAGTVATPVRVVASIQVGGETISTVSEALTITTGWPDQNSFSLSAATLNPGGQDANGIESVLTIRAGDSVNNPVPDGTTINFTTEYGRITSPDSGEVTGACITVDGNCSVIWNSQDPRSNGSPANIGTPLRLDDADNVCPDSGVSGVPCPSFLVDQSDTDFPGQIFGGRTTVLAYATGEEWFDDANGNGLYDYVDVNSNGVYDSGVDRLESFTDLPEAYRDDNGDGVFGNETSIGGCDNAGGDADATALECAGWEEGGAVEPFIDLNANGRYEGDEASPDPLAGELIGFRDGFGNGIYNGVRCSPELEVLGLCSFDLVTVRDSIELVVGGATAWVGFHDAGGNYLPGAAANVDLVGAPGDNVRQVYVSDVFNGYLPAGTTINVTANNCKVFGVTEYEISNTNSTGIFTFSLAFGEDPATDNASDTIDIVITPPDGTGGQVVNTGFVCSDAD